MGIESNFTALCQRHPKNSQGDAFFNDAEQFIKQYKSTINQFILDELETLITQENLERTDVLLLILQGIYPVIPQYEAAVGSALQKLINALIDRGGEDPIRGWLLHQIVDILFHIGALTEMLSESDQIIMAQTLGRIASIKYEVGYDAHHHYCAAYKSVTVLSGLEANVHVVEALTKFTDHFDDGVVEDAVKVLTWYTNR